MRRDPYSPLDVVLANPRVRLLRALRWFGWISATDLLDALDVGSATARNNHSAMFTRLARDGAVERRASPCGSGIEYRITARGRRELAAMLSRRLPVATDREIARHDRELAKHGRSAA